MQDIRNCNQNMYLLARSPYRFPPLAPYQATASTKRAVSCIRLTLNAKHIGIGPTQAHGSDHMIKLNRRMQRRLPWMTILSVKITCGNTCACAIVDRLFCHQTILHAQMRDRPEHDGVRTMSKICEVCGKAPSAGRSISHSHRVTNRMFRPNVQKITIRDEKGHVRKANVCTSCMKAGKVTRA